MKYARILMSAFMAAIIFLAGCDESNKEEEGFPCPMNEQPGQPMPKC